MKILASNLSYKCQQLLVSQAGPFFSFVQGTFLQQHESQQGKHYPHTMSVLQFHYKLT